MSKKRRNKQRQFHRKRKFSNKAETLEGVLSCTAGGGFGFVSVEGDRKDLYVDESDFGTANHGDRVKIKTITHIKGERRRPCKVVEVLERSITRLTAVIISDFGGTLAAKADNSRYYPIIHISYGNTLGASVGDRVAVELTSFDSHGDPIGIVAQNLGSSKTIQGSIDSIVFANFIKSEFSEDALALADTIPTAISEEEIATRLDLRSEKVITIDGDDAKDFDDAVSIRKLAGGMYKLGVHIADVSHYVKNGDRCDLEAYERGTSVYLPDRVIPMLPEKLSNGVCSLLPNEDRLTLSCIMTVTPKGEVKDYKITKSVIRSLHRMTYTNVEKILEGEKNLKKEYNDILLQLTHMNSLADILIEKRKKRGSIDFDLPETHVMLDENYKIGQIVARERLKSHKIIEEFMLLANETVAKHCFENNIPIIYRTHHSPLYEKLENLSLFLHNFGLSLPEDFENVTPETFQHLLSSIDGEPYQQIVAKFMLRSMMKAEYRAENDGHFGLAADYYCHFTSPIRRYPDLIVHRAISGEATGNNKAVSIHSTEAERRAEECERNSVALLKVIYMKEHIGEEFTAVITSLTDFGIYAELDNTIEGMIRLESIGGDYYVYDEKASATIGRRTGKSFKIGDSVEVVVTDANPELLRIDFMLKKDYRKER